MHDEFEKCRKEHINSDDVMMKLYKRGISKEEFRTNLEHILLPVYESARNVGFGSWMLDFTDGPRRLENG